MSEIFVMYELDQPGAARSITGAPLVDGRPVRCVHAAPAAPGSTTTPGPRTLCGKDTFAMKQSPGRPTDPDSSWYTAGYVQLVCAQCDAVMEG
ncbi:hypothetical protein [Streptomyces sp. NBC_01727]|uniref:hypothetical protein n=1 Tax=Streptomyces sp. NBC_01727 TaxID=2975924 RepID=UPI002E0D54F4|nr:hypothetical protein OIE76_37945 [Streptomyces sp. NBC_01727]